MKMFDRNVYQRLSSSPEKDDVGVLCAINFRSYVYAISSLPIVAFFFCVYYSLMYNFQSSTSTLCGAYNILPSISAAIGGYSPQKQVWQIAVSLTFLPRVMLIRDYLEFAFQEYRDCGHVLVYATAVLNFLENCALMLLSFYDSTFNYPMHKTSFIVFIITSELHMLILIYQKSACRYHHHHVINRNEQYGLKLKKVLCAINILSILLAMYYFLVHNIACHDFAYSKFAFFEYVVVLSNIAFHTTVVCDYPEGQIVISTNDCIRFESTHRYVRVLEA